MLASSGYVARVDDGLCTVCEACAGVCAFGALHVNGAAIEVDQAGCMGCGVCVSQCDQGALSLVLAPERGVPLDLTVLQAHGAGGPPG